jgi:hypothetical protein
MPWRCPACQAIIIHGDFPHPNPASRYRCHVCRLELQYSAMTSRLIATTFDPDRQEPVRTVSPVRRVKPPKR